MLENQDFSLPEKKGQLFNIVRRLLRDGGNIHWPLCEKKDPQGEEIGPSPLLNRTNPPAT